MIRHYSPALIALLALILLFLPVSAVSTGVNTIAKGGTVFIGETVVGIVDRLEGRSFVKRMRSKKDLRQVNVRLTAEGKSALRKAPGAAQAPVLDGLEALPDRKLKRLSVSLAQLVRILVLSAKGPIPKRRRGRPRKEESLPVKRRGRKSS